MCLCHYNWTSASQKGAREVDNDISAEDSTVKQSAKNSDVKKEKLREKYKKENDL